MFLDVEQTHKYRGGPEVGRGAATYVFSSCFHTPCRVAGPYSSASLPLHPLAFFGVLRPIRGLHTTRLLLFSILHLSGSVLTILGAPFGRAAFVSACLQQLLTALRDHADRLIHFASYSQWHALEILRLCFIPRFEHIHVGSCPTTKSPPLLMILTRSPFKHFGHPQTAGSLPPSWRSSGNMNPIFTCDLHAGDVTHSFPADSLKIAELLFTFQKQP